MAQLCPDRPLLLLERAHERGQLDVVQIGYGHESHSVAAPAMHLEPADGLDGGSRALAARGGDEDVDSIPPPLVDERCYGTSFEIIQPSADQRETDRGEVRDRWREVESSQEPRLLGELIARLDVEQVIGHERADVGVPRVTERRVDGDGCASE